MPIMRIILKQNFPLGRFHANPWRAFAFDDPHGEWPPSPWRLLRAILARSFQLSRERENPADNTLREQLVRNFSASGISWKLPDQSWRGPGLQQYQPAEFKKSPPAASKPGEKTYNTTKNKDNFWLISTENDALYWVLETKENNENNTTDWSAELLAHLDDCLSRMTYFGRAESITTIERLRGGEHGGPAPNCILLEKRTASSVPVLCPLPGATLENLICKTDDDAVANSTTPPGAIWQYAERPSPVKTIRKQPPRKELPPAQILQFAIGGRVFPPLKYLIRITEKFRGIALRQIARQQTADRNAKFSDLPPEIRAKFSLLTGKDIDGAALGGHHHAAFFLIPDTEEKPSRLVCWRKEPFSTEEQNAFLAAAEAPLAWDFGSDDWKLRLVPLPAETPLPPDKNIFAQSTIWETLIPFVPPLHVFGRNGKPKAGCEIETQIKKMLDKRHLPAAEVSILTPPNAPAQWIKVHRPHRSRDEQTNDDKRAFQIRLTFAAPFSGPLFLGHSAHFGLGLFAPAT
jgi:CRISPR-associated protein Csb2